MMKLKPLSRWLPLLAMALMCCVAGCEAWSSDADSGGGGSGDQGEGGGFLWKPVGENSGRLVVLLPPQYRGRVTSVHIAGSNNQVIEVGVFTGVGNGNRPHYRFSQKGGAYGSNIRVVANLNEGGSVYWPIPSGSGRVEY